MNLAQGLLLLSAMLVPAQGAQPLAADWFGAWTLDRSLSHFMGPRVSIGRTPTGYRFDFGAVSFVVGDDGKDYPTVPTRTTSLMPVGPLTWQRVHKVNGREVDRSTLAVSQDGTAMRIDTVATEADGTTHRSQDVLKRIGSGSGLAGEWRSSVAGINVSERIVVEDAGGGKMRWRYPQDEQSYVALPDGAAVSYEGARAVPGVTIQLREVSPDELRWTEYVNGKPYTEGKDLLSAKGDRLTETTWPVVHPDDVQEAVYTRQESGKP